jgi:hypothetical protein
MATPIISSFELKSSKPLDVRSTVNTVAERNAIPVGERYKGLSIYVDDIQRTFQLRGDITNADWVDNSNIASGSITADMTNIAAINPIDGEINYNKIGTLQLNDAAITEGKILNDAISTAKISDMLLWQVRY